MGDMKEFKMLLEWLENLVRKISLFQVIRASKWNVVHALNIFQETLQFLQLSVNLIGSQYNTQKTLKEDSKLYMDKRGGWNHTNQISLRMVQELTTPHHNQDTERSLTI